MKKNLALVAASLVASGVAILGTGVASSASSVAIADGSSVTPTPTVTPTATPAAYKAAFDVTWGH